MPKTHISPQLLSAVLGQKHSPTSQQADIIGAAPGPMLVVAGAGAGKTETMAARVVWLVANGYAKPEEILGLTFTRKAAQELGKRIKARLSTLAGSPKLKDHDPEGTIAASLEVIAPHVSTYDAYAAELIREYGLLIPAEPSTTHYSEGQMFALVNEVVKDYTGPLTSSTSVEDTTTKVMSLLAEMDNNLLNMAEVYEQANAFEMNMHAVPQDPGKEADYFSKDALKWLGTNDVRRELLPLVEETKKRMREQDATTFAEQMSWAARMAMAHPVVGTAQRSRYKVVMLDEYQDTSPPQRILLRSLFGNGKGQHTAADTAEGAAANLTVTAVGDPMQSIYGWRGATTENLRAFVDDFPQANGQSAVKKELTTSWRNPAGVLRMANIVGDAAMGTGNDRPVKALQPRESAGEGAVKLGYFSTPEEELDYIGDLLAQRFAEEGDALKAAVLCRKSKHVPGIVKALSERGVPFEVTSLAGLLNLPEIQDLVTLARMLVRPQDTMAALRVLSGPIVGLSVADLEALLRRVRNLGGTPRSADGAQGADAPTRDASQEPSHGACDAQAHLRAQLDELRESQPDMVFGLADAVADLGERSRYSPEGLQRLEELAAKLRHLRSYSLHKSLVDIFTDIELMFSVRTEVMARGDAAGTAHLNRFLDVVADYGAGSLDGLLSYLELQQRYDRGMNKGKVPPTPGAVQISTIHSAKGLEWHTVVMPHQTAAEYAPRVSTFLTNPQLLIDDDFMVLEEAETRSRMRRLGEQYKAEKREFEAQESERLFYVGVTRAEQELVVTASVKNDKTEPYKHLAAMAQAAPDYVATWHGTTDAATESSADSAASGTETEAAAQESESRTALFPALHPRPEAVRGAELVKAAMVELPAASAGETFDFWEAEATALIEEQRASQAAVVYVEMPREMTASDVVAFTQDAGEFARRRRRPVPFKPSRYAKRGTAFHAWLEERFGSQALLSEDELPGMRDFFAPDSATADEATGVHPEAAEEELVRLQEAFLASEWAERTPTYVEQAFEFALAGVVLRGRMDAVFDNGDHWLVVDWKTGRRPRGQEFVAAQQQLAVYAEGWRRIAEDGKPVRAAFHYVAGGETVYLDADTGSDSSGGSSESVALVQLLTSSVSAAGEQPVRESAERSRKR